MSSIAIHDLTRSRELDRKTMAAVRGGLGPNVNVNIDLDQRIGQFQDIKVNVLNNNGVIGAGFEAPSLAISPTQWALNKAVVPAF